MPKISQEKKYKFWPFNVFMGINFLIGQKYFDFDREIYFLIVRV